LIANRILDLCKERKLTISKLATLSGLHHSTIDNIIVGKSKSPELRTICRIATGFGMTPSQFLDFPELTETQVEDE
jgi:transcriptional regulator with XRE-family HTH domain